MSRTKTPFTLLKRMVMLALMLGALVFTISDRSHVNVRAEDCPTVTMDLEICYYNCAGYPTYEGRRQCYSQCEFTNAMRGATCNYPSYSPMMIGGGGCDAAANGQRAYTNCLAGTLANGLEEQYFIYMAYYNDQETSCAMIGQSVELQGCW